MTPELRILSLLVAGVTVLQLSTGPAHADLLVEEQFIYDSGANIDGQNGGLGFDGAWASTISHGRIYDIQTTGLSFSTLRMDGLSVSRFGSAGRAQANRVLSSAAQATLTTDNTTVWFSLLFQPPSAHRYASFLFGTGAFTTGGSPVLATAGDGFGITLVAANGTGDGGGNINALAFNGATTPTVVTSTFNPGTNTALLLGKINWKPGGTPDEFFLFNVTDLTTEPQEAAAIASITNLDFDQSAIDTISIWDTNNAITDEIRFATTFDEAMGAQPDFDEDGMPDAYELLHTTPPSTTALLPGDDLEHGEAGDGLTNLQEYQLGTDPNDPDTDGDMLEDGPETTGVGSRPATDPTLADTDDDGLDDNVETNTGAWVNGGNTGTDPTATDTDQDGLRDGVETNTDAFVSESNTGTDPLVTDSDADGAGDWYEVAASYTDPNVPGDKPSIPYPLPDPDGSTGTTDQPVKVYILSGQSNMVGAGAVNGSADKTLETMTVRQNKFPDLIDGTDAWTTRQDVRYRGVISDFTDAQLSPGALGSTFGPELGFGYIMGWHHDAPVLLLKSCTGNRSLGWDVLPPGSESYVYGDTNYAGYGDWGNWDVGDPEPTSGTWYAGKEFDRFFMDEADWIHADPADTNVVDVLDNFATEYPDWASQGFEIAGFVWWQGDKDRYDMGHATRYELNLVNLINSLRDYYENRYPGQVVDDAPFVLATLGQTPLDSTHAAEREILDAQLAVDGESGNYPLFAGNVKTVYSHPLSQGGASNSHYNGHAATYMLIGDALGRAMVDLLGSTTTPDYDTWAANWPGEDLSDPNADLDGDGLTNDQERIFGLDPTSGSSANPFSVPLDATAGSFSYTRRDDALTGLTYTLWTSPNLQPGSWAEDTGAVQTPGTPDANGVETVSVTLSPALLTGPRLFVRMQAAE